MSEQTTLDVQPTSGSGPAMTTAELNERLHAHFIAPADRLKQAGAGAVYLTEVTAPGTSGRRADAVHIGLWQSRGAGRIDVCELKVSRADFRRELEQPAKAEAWWPYSTTFSIVSPGVHVTPPDELPPGWGLMVPGGRGRRFKTVVKPAEREPRLTIGLLLTLLKNTETTRVNALQAQGQQLRAQHYDEVQKVRRERGNVSPKDVKRLELLERLEKAMDMQLGEYAWRDQLEPEHAAEGLAAFMRGQNARRHARETAEQEASSLERIAVRAAEEAKELRRALARADETAAGGGR
ncbi:hypothetical protein PV382_17950 [Streptomyces scabiei]|uniref:hypothetical protein n=1 Tax=Streptomyces scabiei TaxID=1930 RepID=UPI000765CCBA|nr:hypothetical protein [Streptomyces scabiei]MDX2658296.1 hypothetical protein [Streptomyces scabiei]MDX2870581.1 hypothetical protein [Streptomyces scabiei]MDX2996406.1 hypothetical protein [Streptomyces scabiei]MDX3049883.1 hypothetical protein [Streptomyces scabiei]MDX3174160.1 hypothetical protein [Streptomyces scabiei]